jgi:class 3 adenylate cyclase/tetratricopeptide (TPR) repeat protein
MTCARCHHENRVGAKFCEECAAPLPHGCARCGGELSATAKFCPECGEPVAVSPTPSASPEAYTPRRLAEKIIASRSALEAGGAASHPSERKQVTVLFADVKGSMELLADRDPEEARTILDPVLERMMEAVHRYEGTVNQVMGDGIMALFGAPVAHEDHAVRACYAALRMQELVKGDAEDARRTHGLDVKVRIGLNSGEVVVRAIGSDLRMDYTAVGQTTHLAARMEQLASPGTVLLTASTLALAEGFVAVKPLGPVPVKGLADAVEVYELTGAGPARTRLQAAAARGLTRFVGRDAERDELRHAQDLSAEGHGQVVAIVGEAGVGKSRLVHEFRHSSRVGSAKGAPGGWLVLEAAPVSYGRTRSYLPVIDLLRSYFAIHDGDGAREIREKVTGKLVMLDEALRPLLPPLLALLDVPVDDAAWRALGPGPRRLRTIDAVKRVLLRQAREQPALLIIEDLHWIDGETRAVLDGLVDGLGSSRLLLLVNYRPEYQHAWRGKPWYREIRLDALPAASAAALVDALLGDDPGLTPLKQRLAETGNPFFLEETVRMLVETKALVGQRGRYRLARPVHATQVPPTVQPILAARIDRLVPEDKRLLQTAAVVGHRVPFALLEAIADPPLDALRAGLDRLQAAEFLDEVGLYPDFEYAFAHALTHEVAYGGLLQERRRELHARIVDVIETRHRDRLGEHIERLAHHAVRAGLWDKAVRYLREAGRTAAARSALQQARGHLDQAITILDTLPESPSLLDQGLAVRLELRAVLILLGEVRGALGRLREAEALAERLGDDRRRAQVWSFMTNLHTLVGELDEACTAGSRALASARATGDVDVTIRTTTSLEQARYFMGEYEEVVALATGNLAAMAAVHARHGGSGTRAAVFDRHFMVVSLAELGRFAEAAAHVPEMTRLAEQTKHAFTVGVAPWAVGMLHLAKGEWAEARSAIGRAIAVHRDGDVRLMLPEEVASLAWIAARLGHTSEATVHLREAGRLVDESREQIAGHLGFIYLRLGRASLALGRLDEARRLGERVLEAVPSQRGLVAHARHLLGDGAAHPDRFDPASAEAHYRGALALAASCGMRPLVAHGHLGLGRLYRRTGKRHEAKQHVAVATAMYREMDMRSSLAEADVASTALDA